MKYKVGDIVKMKDNGMHDICTNGVCQKTKKILLKVKQDYENMMEYKNGISTISKAEYDKEYDMWFYNVIDLGDISFNDMCIAYKLGVKSDEDCSESWYDEFDLDGGDGLCNCDPADCECGDNWFPDEKDYLVEEILNSPKDEKDLEDDDNHK